MPTGGLSNYDCITQYSAIFSSLFGTQSGIKGAFKKGETIFHWFIDHVNIPETN